MATIKEWLESTIGQPPFEEGGADGTQCPEILYPYLRECFGLNSSSSNSNGNGKDAAKNVARKFPQSFTYIPYFNGIKPQTGDIISFNSKSAPQYGHVAICYESLDSDGNYWCVDQWAGASAIRSKARKVLSPKVGVNDSLIGLARPLSTDATVDISTNHLTDYTTMGSMPEINYADLTPYIAVADKTVKSIDFEDFAANQILGVLIEIGEYFSPIHQVNEGYLNPNINNLVDSAVKNSIPYGFMVKARSREVDDVLKELKDLKLVIQTHIPGLGLWLDMDFTKYNSVPKNIKILEKYKEELTRWGLKGKLGLSADRSQLELIGWSLDSEYYSEERWNDWNLWLIDHTSTTEEFMQVVEPQFFFFDTSHEHPKIPIISLTAEQVEKAKYTNPDTGEVYGFTLEGLMGWLTTYGSFEGLDFS